MPRTGRVLPDTLVRLTERVWFLPHDEPTDRPVLGYARGDRLALAVDAGASPAHVAAFYRALENEGLPLPGVTALTHLSCFNPADSERPQIMRPAASPPPAPPPRPCAP